MQSPCLRCARPVEFTPVFELLNEDHGVYCDECAEKVTAEERLAHDAGTLERRWLCICPLRYQDTEPGRLPYPDRSARALVWNPKDGAGLNLWGYPDTGKTRTLLLVLRSCHFSRRQVKFLEAGQFSRLCDEYAYRTGTLAKKLSSVEILAIDDLDKLCLTKPQEMALFAVLDQRMSRNKPTLFTHNSTAAELELHFRRCGESLTRRILRQGCVSIHFPARTTQGPPVQLELGGPGR